MKDEDLYTTDYKKCRENAETKIYIKFLGNINWDQFNHDELEKIYGVVGDIIALRNI